MKIKAFDSVVFMNFAQCSPVTSAAWLVKQRPQKSLRTYARAAFICCIVTCLSLFIAVLLK